MHAYFAERGNGIKVFAGYEHEADGCDERVDFVDDDALATAQKAADLGIVPSERGLNVMAFRAMQCLPERRFDKSRGAHGSMTCNRNCVLLRISAGNFGPVLLNALKVDQSRDAGCRTILRHGQFLERAPLVGHEPHIDRLVGQHATRSARDRGFLTKHGGILPFGNLAQQQNSGQMTTCQLEWWSIDRFFAQAQRGTSASRVEPDRICCFGRGVQGRTTELRERIKAPRFHLSGSSSGTRRRRSLCSYGTTQRHRIDGR
ncbi:Uncharacterised protein [Burkholderia pseudomallei]|nr:Uncharacterised protein [Burkholderia pseudomallei]CAJ8968571.1 Uncharacterised protein [Burkholderia pseudomallei]CAK0158985.1 Uncharacterised protein [Burkholderia pseudomallei]